MSIDIRLPNITASTPEGKLNQMQSYMHQLVQQLNWALNTVESAQAGQESPTIVYKKSEPSSPKDAEATFNSIKALIIKSADIVKAYEDTIRTSFDGVYVAESAFGTFVEKTNRTVEENSKGVTESYDNFQKITNEAGTGALDTLAEDVRTTNAYIKRGHLYYDSTGKSVVGIEIGETTDDGIFRQYARFTSEKLSFHDINGNEVAYIGAGTADEGDTKCLYVTGKAVFLGEIQLGFYKTDTSDGLAFTWIGG